MKIILYSKLVNDLEIILFAQQRKPLDPMQPKMKIGWMQQKLQILLTKKHIREKTIKHRNRKKDHTIILNEKST